MEALRQPVMTVAASSTLVNCLQKAALGKQQSGSPCLKGHEAEVLQLLRAIAAQYATHGSLQCARSVWHGEHTSLHFTRGAFVRQSRQLIEQWSLQPRKMQ